MQRTKVADLLRSIELGKPFTVKGWVRTRRGNKQVNFVALNDGSGINNLQIIVDMEQFDEALVRRITTGAAISVDGELQESQGSGQNVELMAKTIEILGDSDPDKYPLQPKKHSLEFLREIAHLRFRTNTFGAIARVTHSMAFAVHEFFHKKGFYNIHTPIITASDAEGAGEMFQVTTLDPDNLPRTEDGKIDYSKDFFGKPTNLTVSGQLEGELAALALSEIYTFGPTFRAENSNTSRHLSEFWMIEPEMAFYELKENMDLAEEFLKYLIQYALNNCKDDLEFLSQRQQQEEKGKKEADRAMELIEKLKFVLENDFVRLT
jgi:asparaginyl-tRNA synthetase